MRAAAALLVVLAAGTLPGNAKLASMHSLARQDPAAPPRIGHFRLSRPGDGDDFDPSPEGIRGFCATKGLQPLQRPARIIEVMSFLRETHLLATKLRELHDIVDTFVVVEGTTTFSGEPVRPWLREGLLSELGPWLGNKVIALTQDGLPPCADIAPRLVNVTDVKLPDASEPLGPWKCSWAYETERRRVGLSYVLERLGVQDSDLVVVSDADEVMSRSVARVLKYCNTSKPDSRPDVVVPLMSLHYFGLMFHNPSMWMGMVAIRGWRLKEVGAVRASLVRVQRGNPFGIKADQAPAAFSGGGWHMSFFQSDKAIRRKLPLQSHHELRHARLLDPQRIRACQRGGMDIYGRPDLPLMSAEEAAERNIILRPATYLRQYGPQSLPRLFTEYPDVFANRRQWVPGSRVVPSGADADALWAECVIQDRE